jgi:FkbM family methyltransferase
VVFDVGANVGDWAAQLIDLAVGSRARGGVLHLFEPVEATMVLLRQKLSVVPSGWRVLFFSNGMSHTSGKARISVVADGSGINAIAPDPLETISRIEAIDLTTVDDHCRANNVAEIAFLKVDTEGHDLFVLHGAAQMMAERRIHVIQFEYNHRWVWSHAFLYDVFAHAATHGYALGKVTPAGIEFYSRWHPELERFIEGNYVLCRSDWVSKFPRVAWWNEPQG